MMIFVYAFAWIVALVAGVLFAISCFNEVAKAAFAFLIPAPFFAGIVGLLS